MSPLLLLFMVIIPHAHVMMIIQVSTTQKEFLYSLVNCAIGLLATAHFFVGMKPTVNQSIFDY